MHQARPLFPSNERGGGFVGAVVGLLFLVAIGAGAVWFVKSGLPGLMVNDVEAMDRAQRRIYGLEHMYPFQPRDDTPAPERSAAFLAATETAWNLLDRDRGTLRKVVRQLDAVSPPARFSKAVTVLDGLGSIHGALAEGLSEARMSASEYLWTGARLLESSGEELGEELAAAIDELDDLPPSPDAERPDPAAPTRLDIVRVAFVIGMSQEVVRSSPAARAMGWDDMPMAELDPDRWFGAEETTELASQPDLAAQPSNR